jgi:hypothetical protein
MIERDCPSKGRDAHIKNAGRFAALVLATTLIGCVDDAMEDCESSVEPSLLMRQLVLGAEKQKGYQNCKQIVQDTPKGACEVIWLDADRALTACMARHGYSLRPIQSEACKSYYDAACYGPSWFVKLVKAIRE